MDEPKIKSMESKGRGCLVLASVGLGFVILMAILIPIAREMSRRDFERSRSELRMRMFSQVKNGDDGSRVFIFDLLQIEMLANDADCVANLKMLHFSSVDLSNPLVSAAGKLTNVRTIYFYDSYNPENLFLAMKGLPSVEEVQFETSHIPDNTATLLTGFPNLKKVGIDGQILQRPKKSILEKHYQGLSWNLQRPLVISKVSQFLHLRIEVEIRVAVPMSWCSW
jgi:hypothetical protein